MGDVNPWDGNNLGQSSDGSVTQKNHYFTTYGSD